MTYLKKAKKDGFVLLLTLIVVSIVLAIGITMLDNTIKQVTLSSTGRDSEVAFHAAYAGAECAQYWRTVDLLDVGTDFFIDRSFAPPEPCMDNMSDFINSYIEIAPDVHLNTYEITWGAGSDHCTQIDLYVYDASAGDVTYDIPYYGSGVETCTAGLECTIVFSRGYNRSCSDINSLRTVQREVVLEF